TLNVNANTTLDRGGSVLTNAGHIHIAPGKTLEMSSFGSFVQTAGETQNDGVLKVTPASGDIKIQGGLFHGIGTVTGKLTVSGSGQLAPGDSIGTMAIT